MSETKKCPRCNTELPDHAKFCLSCGAAVEDTAVESNKKTATCIYCHASIPADSLECPNCHHAFAVMRCPECQAVIPKSAIACPSCGKTVNQNTAPSPQPEPAYPTASAYASVQSFSKSNRNLKECSACGNMVSKDAVRCPACGKKLKRRGPGCGALMLIAFCIVALIISFYDYLGKVREDDTTSTTLTRAEIEKKVETVSYNSLARDPDAYKGTYLKLELDIEQIITISSVTYYHVYEDGDEYVMTDCRKSQTPKLLEGDTITVFCEFAGTRKMERALTHVEVEVPFIKAYYIEIEDAE